MRAPEAEADHGAVGIGHSCVKAGPKQAKGAIGVRAGAGVMGGMNGMDQGSAVRGGRDRPVGKVAAAHAGARVLTVKLGVARSAHGVAAGGGAGAADGHALGSQGAAGGGSAAAPHAGAEAGAGAGSQAGAGQPRERTATILVFHDPQDAGEQVGEAGVGINAALVRLQGRSRDDEPLIKLGMKGEANGAMPVSRSGEKAGGAVEPGDTAVERVGGTAKVQVLQVKGEQARDRYRAVAEGIAQDAGQLTGEPGLQLQGGQGVEAGGHRPCNVLHSKAAHHVTVQAQEGKRVSQLQGASNSAVGAAAMQTGAVTARAPPYPVKGLGTTGASVNKGSETLHKGSGTLHRGPGMPLMGSGASLRDLASASRAHKGGQAGRKQAPATAALRWAGVGAAGKATAPQAAVAAPSNDAERVRASQRRWV